MYHYLRDPYTSRSENVLRPNALPALKDRICGTKIESALAHMLASMDGSSDLDAPAFFAALNVLQLNYRIITRWDWRSRHDLKAR
jgi:hypothetical protein